MTDKKSQFSQIEEEMLKVWEKEKTFQKSLAAREGKQRFSFYDGPPYANGLPHHGHVVPVSIKDTITRYKTMRGYYVPRRLGWDCHGLPVENLIEKELGFKDKKDIIKYGVDKFNQLCRESVFKYKNEWEQFFSRIGRWADAENAYATLDDNYIESVWWAFSELYKKDLVYQDFRSMPYCPRCATPLSNFELNQGYRDDVEDPSLYITFPLKGDNKTSLLAWTTTPWTLPANAALAVDSAADYVIVELNDKSKLILAKKRVDKLNLKKNEYKITKTQKGQELVGLEYQPLYKRELKPEEAKKAYRVYADSSVSLDDGTGILHVAPRYGETDLELGQKEGLPLLESVDANGRMIVEGIDVKGKFFKSADSHIIAELTKQGKVFAAETFKHTYPFCWRCDTPLMYYAIKSWFVKVSGFKDELVANNQKVNWVPSHLRDGRFGKWLEGARDWGISRNRFWGAPLPIWVNTKESTDQIVIGSLSELRQLSGIKEKFDLHRPGIDEVQIKKDGKTYKRVAEIFDVWFESGSMPYAQDHYPFEHKSNFAEAFPADFIAEGIDQTRGWFYTLHVLASALFDKPAYQNVITNGWVTAADGQKLSKRLKNYVPLDAVFDEYGADVLRFFMLNSPAVAGEDVRFSSAGLKDVQRNVFMTLFNTYKFFKTYTDIDKWIPPKNLEPPASDNILDQWIMALLNQIIKEVTKQTDKYQLAKATQPIIELIDQLSNWYVRRSRRRFWKSEDDEDKLSAYATLHFVLVNITQLIAPFAPFLADKIYRDLRSSSMPSSVHLTDWPIAGSVNRQPLNQMEEVRSIVAEGLSQRAAAGIKVRQPLQKATVPKLPEHYKSIMIEELNIKELNWGSDNSKVVVDTTLTDELKIEGLMRELVRHIQNARKKAGLDVENRIHLGIRSKDSMLNQATTKFYKEIKSETLANTLNEKTEYDYSEDIDIYGMEITIGISKY
ncbi:MAG TPA: isoleucine--tRNA ligase [Candidatus Saccharimonadales bacterium]|nr:isoleucine--tRNA ligase [Candidatus Saccharimonadales bacterium]